MIRSADIQRVALAERRLRLRGQRDPPRDRRGLCGAALVDVRSDAPETLIEPAAGTCTFSEAVTPLTPRAGADLDPSTP